MSMQPAIIVCMFFLLCIIITLLILDYQKRAKQIKLTAFGSDNVEVAQYSATEEKSILILIQMQYLSQQKWSFRLLFFAILISILLAVWIVFNIVNGQFDTAFFEKAVGVAGGTAFSITAYKFYQDASKRLESFK